MRTVFSVTFAITTARKGTRISVSPSPSAEKSEPIYIIEVGAGHGKLGFLILNHLRDLQEFMPDG